MKKTIEEVAEDRYREYPNNPLYEYNRDANCFRKKKHSSQVLNTKVSRCIARRIYVKHLSNQDKRRYLKKICLLSSQVLKNGLTNLKRNEKDTTIYILIVDGGVR